VTNNDCTIWMHRLARRVCRAYCRVPYDEALSAALVGMALALQGFDPARQSYEKHMEVKGYFATVQQLREDRLIVHPGRVNKTELLFLPLRRDVGREQKPCGFNELIETCTPRQQGMLEMQYVCGLSGQEIADRFGCSVRTAWKVVSDGRAKIKDSCS